MLPLLKSRVLHTRIFLFSFLPVIVLGLGVLSEDHAAHEIMEWAGHILVVLCVLGRSYCAAYIGGRKNDELIQQGPFAIVRNPLYVFSFLGIAGIGMQSGMLTVLGLLITGFVLYYPRVVAREEAYLLDRFGTAYLDYMQSVPRWWPRWKNWREPETIVTQPRMLREAMRDASAFFIPFPVLELIDALHANGILPAYMILP